ncbi:uncharacterized protein LOC128240252 [Mya arenaria]|uniref:uncharacterized protein LOC128240252 n=1 Tax=Mya arenaria TaxID=6604 RepID=UPI0022E16FE6|nr:uncharacterized protein LOC128240252 [Mya arenaria]
MSKVDMSVGRTSYRITVYKDNRPCYKCISHGCIRDGENLCSACQEYMCLNCTIIHGRECVFAKTPEIFNKTAKTKNIAHKQNDVQSKITHGRETTDASRNVDNSDVKADTTGKLLGRTTEDVALEKGVKQPPESGSSKASKSSSKRICFSAHNGLMKVGYSDTPDSELSIMRCLHHSDSNIENYCRHHDALCCENCLRTDHRICTIQPIDEVAYGIKDDKRMADIINEVKRVKEEFRVYIDRNERLVRQMKSSDGIENPEHIECAALSKELNLSLTACKYIATNIDVALHEIETSIRKGIDVYVFVALKRNQPLIVKSKQKLAELQIFEEKTANNNRDIFDKIRKFKDEAKSDDSVKQNEDNVILHQTRKYAVDEESCLSDGNATFTIRSKRSTSTESLLQSDDGSRTIPSRSDYFAEEYEPSECAVDVRPISKGSQRSVGFRSYSDTSRYNYKPRTNSGRIKGHGLVTEYYMQDILGTSNDKICRLHSAPPVRFKEDTNDENGTRRPKSMYCSDEGRRHQSKELQTEKYPIEGLGSIRLVLNSGTDRSAKIKMLQTAREESAKAIKYPKKKTTKKQLINSRNEPVSNTPAKTTRQNSRNNFRTSLTTDSKPSRAAPLLMKQATFIKAPDPERKVSAKSRASKEEELLYNHQNYARRPRTKLVLTSEQIVQMQDDSHPCEVNGIACMPDGRILVSDFTNIAVKLFRTDWRHASRLALDELPRGITAVSNVLAAVITGLARDHLLLISVGNGLEISKRYNTGCMCTSIDSYGSHIYILCQSNFKAEVRVMNTEGVVNIRISLDRVIATPTAIAVNPLNGVMYITDATQGVHVVETGMPVKRTSDKNIERYHGVAIDLNNTVYVCSERVSGVHELSYDGKHLMPVLLGYDDEGPRMVCYNQATNTLVTSSSKGGTIQIYKIIDQLLLHGRK